MEKKVRVDIRGGLRKTVVSSWWFESLLGAFLLGFLWPVILPCLVPSLYLVYLRVFCCACIRLLAKMDSSEEAYE